MRVWALIPLTAALGLLVALGVRLVPRHLPVAAHQRVVAVIALLAGALAALVSEASSTGGTVVDAAYRAVVVGLTAYLGSRLSLEGLVAATVATALLSGGRGGAALSVVAAAGVLVGCRAAGFSVGSGRSRPVAAVVAGCCALGLIQPGAMLPTGASAAASASGAVLVLLCLGGYRQAPGHVRRPIRIAVLGACAAFGVAGALSAVALVQARPSLQAGVASATRGVSQARQLESPAAIESMDAAAVAFDRAKVRIRSPLGQAGTVVPLLGQQVRAVEVASVRGGELGRAAAELGGALDQTSLRIVGGRIPVEKLVEAEPKAAQTAATIASARLDLARQRSPWLLPPIARRISRVEAELVPAGRQADLAAALLEEVPPLLGSKGPRRYFLAVQTPSELRGSGGFMGTFVEILADDGRLTLGRTGRPSDLDRVRSTPERTLDAPADFLARYGQFDVARTWENVNISPHFPADAQVIRSLYPQSGGQAIDAVAAIDPFAIQALLGVVGPVQVPGAPAPLTGENAAEVLLFEQYRVFGDGPQDERRDFLAGAMQGLNQQILTGEYSLRNLVTALGPMVEQKHLLLSAGTAAEEPAFIRLGLTGAMAPQQGDSLAVVLQNRGSSKIDWFLRRTVDYAATVDLRSGALTARATVQLTNQAPAAGLPAYQIGNSVGLPLGSSRLYVSIYSPLIRQGATIDGGPLVVESQTEQDRGVYSAFVDVPPGGTRTLVLDLSGAVRPDRPYRLDLHRQPSVAPDAVSVTLTRSGAGGPPTRRELQLTTDSIVEEPLAG